MMELFKKAEIYGSLASVYHGSKQSPEEFVNLWKSGNFAPGLGSGSMYGPGIYSVYERVGSATGEGMYGDYIYKFIVNISDYLILDEAAFNIVHPRDASLPYDEKLKLQFKKFNISWNVEVPRVQPEFTSDIAEIIQDNGTHQGLIFTGRQDGNICVIYNPYSARMVGYSSTSKKYGVINEVRFGMEEIRENNITGEPLKREGYTEEERWRYLANTYVKHKPDSFFDYFDKIKAALGEEEAKVLAMSIAQNLADLYLPGDFFDSFKGIQAALGEAEAKRLALPVANNLVKNDPDSFFYYFDKIQAALGETEAKELARSAAKNLAEDNPSVVFYYFDKIQAALGETEAKELARSAAKNLAEDNPVSFFLYFYKIQAALGEKEAKVIAIPVAQNLAQNFTEHFFDSFDEIEAALGEAEANKLNQIALEQEQIAESKKTTASSKSRRFNKIARYLRLAKIG